MMSHRNLSSMALAAMTVLTPMLAAAQGAPTTKYVVLSNVNAVAGQPAVDGHAAIPMLANAAAIPDAVGNIVVSCALDGSSKCPNVGTGSGGGTAPTAPVVTVTVNGPPGTVTSSGSSLSWSVSAAKTCVGDGVTVSPASGPAVTGWSKEQPASGGNFSLTTLFNALPANDTEYTYTFNLDCYSSATTTISGTTVAAVGEGQRVVKLKKASGGGGGTDYCSEYYPAGHPARSQPGFTTSLTRVSSNFNVVFQKNDGTPLTESDVLLSGTTGRGPLPTPSTGPDQYLSVAFTVPASTPAKTGIKFAPFEPQGWQGLTAAEKWEISISPCPGDFRAIPAVGQDNPNDLYDRATCRIKNSGTLFSSTGNLSGPTLPACFLKPGATMYINATAHDLNAFRSNGGAPVWGCATGITQCGLKVIPDRLQLAN